MDDVYDNDPDYPYEVYPNEKDTTVESYEPLRWPIQAQIVEVPEPQSVPSPQTFDVSEPNSSKQRSQQKSFSATQVLLIVAVAIFVTLSIVFMVMYFMAERRNCSDVTNNSKSMNYSMRNGRCPVGCVRNSATRRKSTGCADLNKKGKRIDGVYTIDPDGLGAFEVRCDMTTSGGGWTIFQRRIDGSVDFYLGWNDYKKGFGNPNGEFWLGLDKIHRLTKSKQNVLRVDLKDFENDTRYAHYSTFAVANETEKYKLTVGGYSGDAGDSLRYHDGRMFTTKDKDNDEESRWNCAVVHKGAWWYNDCHHSNLNGLYLRGANTTYGEGVSWYLWRGYRYSLKKTEMKIRPRSF